MDFRSDRPIYQQIIDLCFRKVMTREWHGDERIPSVRDLATLLQVNPNTVVKAYEHLQNEDIIYMKRGLGYFLYPNALESVRQLEKKKFFEQQLPELFRTLDDLDIHINELLREYERHRK